MLPRIGNRYTTEFVVCRKRASCNRDGPVRTGIGDYGAMDDEVKRSETPSRSMTVVRRETFLGDRRLPPKENGPLLADLPLAPSVLHSCFYK